MKNLFKKIILLFFIGIIFLFPKSSPVHADSVVLDCDLHNPTGGNSTQFSWASGQGDPDLLGVATSFSSSGDISSATFELAYSSPGDDIHFDVQTNNNGRPSGTLVDSNSTGTMSASYVNSVLSNDGNPHKLTGNFNGTFHLSGGTYWLVLYTTANVTTSGQYNWQYLTSQDSGCNAFGRVKSSNTWQYPINLYVQYQLIGTPGPSPTPTPTPTPPPSTFTVNSSSDGVDANPGNGVCETSSGNGQCTLRAAIMETNALPSGHYTIVVPSGTYALSIAGGNEQNAATGDLNVSGDITIAGAGISSTILDANSLDRLLEIKGGATVTIHDLTIKNGNTSSDSPQFYTYGGAIWNYGTADLHNVKIVDNTSYSGDGGAIFNNGTLNISDGIIANNVAGVGGAIFGYGTMTLTNVEISNNIANSDGGGLGGGQGSTLTNVTFSNNSAANTGGAIRIDGGLPTSLTNVTFKDNSSTYGDSLFLDGGSIQLKNTIVANNRTSQNCGTTGSGNITSLGHNIDTGTSCGFVSSGDLSSTNPMLGSLQNNGGISRTYALLTSSPAIDTGTNSGCPATDQRGGNYLRPVNGNGGGAVCDIGAFEVQGPSDLSAYFTVNDGTNFKRSSTPFTTGVPTQTVNGDGSITVSINNATGYADSGFVLYNGTLGNLSNVVINGTGDDFGMNIWFDKNTNNEFFTWSNNILTGLGDDTYALGPGSQNGVTNITNSSQFFLMSDGQNHTLSSLKNGDVSGINSNTHVTIWIGVDAGSGSKSATITSVSGL